MFNVNNVLSDAICLMPTNQEEKIKKKIQQNNKQQITPNSSIQIEKNKKIKKK